MQLLPVYYRKHSYDFYGKLSLRVVLPHQAFDGENKTIIILRSDDYKLKRFFLNIMSATYVTESILMGRWARYKDLK